MSELMLNPNLRVQPVLTDGRVTAYSLLALVRGRGRLASTVAIAAASPEVTRVLKGLSDADADVEVDETAFASLVDLGVLVQDHEISRGVGFSCRLPVGAPVAPAALTVNPQLAITAFEDFARTTGLVGVLEPCTWIAVVADPVTGARWPYWIDDRDHALLLRLVPGAPPPAELDAAELDRLAGAGILVDADAVAYARQRIDAAAAQFARSRYAELPGLLPAPQMLALCSYYRGLRNEGHLFSQDDLVPLRHAMPSERVMQYYHRELYGLFARVIGDPIKPSYAYLASYRRGAALARHLDREQCKFTASLLLEYLAGPSDDRVWPIHLELPASDEPVAVHLEPGDCLLFSGCDQPHYRQELRGERSTSFLLHYVDEAFSGSLE
ncbi:MAG TPA: hypothetical protein VF516_40665 [Kofleriaceae bacterium]